MKLKMKGVRFGYSFWGFLGDVKLDGLGNSLSTPDGNATYSFSILHEAQLRGWDTILMQQDRDAPGYKAHDISLFSSFSCYKRGAAYRRSHQSDGYPELDVLLLEWRFPIPGRNVGVTKVDPNYQPDFDRQMALLHHYRSKNTKIIIWDLDHKLTIEDEHRWYPHAIFETSVTPRRQVIERTRVEPPICISELSQFDVEKPDPLVKMAYIGSRYERDDVIEEYLAPLSREWGWDQAIRFWGNWTRPDNLKECMVKWPNFSYNGRITTRDFRKVYAKAVCVPLLAKRSYMETGFITPRPWEALMFGSIPIGFTATKGIENYVLYTCTDAYDIKRVVEHLERMSLADRRAERKENIEKIEFMDVSNFVDRIEEVLDGTNGRRLVQDPTNQNTR